MAALLKRSWLSWLRRRTTDGGTLGSPGDGVDHDPLLLAGTVLRQAREQRGLNLRQLAMETRISTPVLEALERGWPDRLPEAAYLRTMLPLLERYLQLERGSLRGALSESQSQSPRSQTSTGRPPLLSVELFTTWQGTAVYGGLMLALLYGLNLEQRRLAAQGYLALAPLPPMAQAAQQQQLPQGSDLLLRDHPDLRPLALASRGQALALLKRHKQAETAERGLLQLRFERASKLDLQAADGVRSQLQAGPGELAMALQTPLVISIEPPPSAGDAVQWNGVALPPQQPGRYRWPLPAAAAKAP